MDARVALLGCGGLGSHVAVFLVRSGVGHVRLIDHDDVELTNIHRQDYVSADVGRDKVHALAERLQAISPRVEVSVHRGLVTRSNVLTLVEGYPYVVEAFDQPQTKAIITETLLADEHGPVVIGASGLAGSDDLHTIITRRLSRRWYLCGDGMSDVAEFGSLWAHRVAVCAAHQAATVIHLIEKGESHA